MSYVTKQEFDALEKRVAKLESSDSSRQNTRNRQTTIIEFILEKNRKSGVDTTICLLYFLEEFGGYGEGVSSENIKEAFKEAREKGPKNISDALAQCAKRGWIFKIDTQDKQLKWKLTNTGAEYVETLGEN